MALPGPDLQAAKARLRRELGARRQAVSRANAQRAAQALRDFVLADAEIRTATRLALYAALPDEFPTRPLFEALASAGAELLFPRAEPDARLAFVPVLRWTELEPGRFGVLEPPKGKPPVALAPADLVFVPGVAFDASGQRLGRGQGNYDRTFPSGVPGPRLFGVCYVFQIVSSVPCDSRDRAMDAIVTDLGIQRVVGKSA